MESPDTYLYRFGCPIFMFIDTISCTLNLIVFTQKTTKNSMFSGETFYLGTNAITSSSQISAIALTSNDSNIIIENYQNERVVLSGGTLLELQWSVHTKTLSGDTIMKAQVPPSVNLDQFNELYIDDRRAIVAKYPNGDPSTKGLYVNDTGFSNDSQSWIRSLFSPGTAIHIQTPNLNGTEFPNYHLIVGGHASIFNPPRSFWPGYGIPRGFAVKNDVLPHLSNWSNPTTGEQIKLE